VDSFDGEGVIDCGRILVVFLVGDFADRASENLSTSRLGQLLHQDHSDQASKSTNIRSHFVVDFLLKVCNFLVVQVTSSFASKDDKG